MWRTDRQPLGLTTIIMLLHSKTRNSSRCLEWGYRCLVESEWDHSQIGSYSSEFKLENRKKLQSSIFLASIFSSGPPAVGHHWTWKERLQVSADSDWTTSSIQFLHTILFVYIIVNVCKQLLISWGWCQDTAGDSLRLVAYAQPCERAAGTYSMCIAQTQSFFEN